MFRLIFALAALFALALATAPVIAETPAGVRHRTVAVDGVNVFYREAGSADKPAILLLHGFPTSSHMFRDLMPRLSKDYRLVAPDLPGFGFSDAPDRAQFKYTFENLTNVVERFADQVGLNRFAIYAFDYGGPVAFRLALKQPNRVTAIVSQNANIYDEGLSPLWAGFRKYWAEPSDANRDGLRILVKPGRSRAVYLRGVDEAARVAPDVPALDDALMTRPGNDEIQLDLFLDYASNVALFPKFQEYLRTRKPPLLAIWGKNDPLFLPAGAEAFRRDQPNADVRFVESGHFALASHGEEIAAAMREFLRKQKNLK